MRLTAARTIASLEWACPLADAALGPIVNTRSSAAEAVVSDAAFAITAIPIPASANCT